MNPLLIVAAVLLPLCAFLWFWLAVTLAALRDNHRDWQTAKRVPDHEVPTRRWRIYRRLTAPPAEGPIPWWEARRWYLGDEEKDGC